ncbi:hypothetical protein KAX35_05935, partial [candidate division WOR-3 bacterium]|nr:hypothetical protein [candidate division WOR-3 bacterium]
MDKRENLRKVLYPLSLIFILSLFFILLENKYPYYFLQDDNRDMGLPYFVHNFRSLLINKEIPLYNPHQFLGTPHLAVGQTAALYPPVYLSVFLSKVFLGHYFAAVDILVFLHLVIGSLGFYLLMRLLGLEGRFAFFGAMTWPLCSFVVYVSNSWGVISGAAAYFPWIIYFSLRLYKRPNYKNLVGLVVSRLLLFYIGYVQFFVLSVIFELLSFLIITFGQPVIQFNKNLIKVFRLYFLSYIYTLILSLPLLLPMWHQMNISSSRACCLNWEEFSSGNYNFLLWFNSLVYPFAKLYKTTPNIWIDNYLPYLSHIGYFGLIFLINYCVVFAVRRFRGLFSEKESIYFYSFFILALIATLWSFGLFNPALYKIPILNRFRWSFKLNFFASFYLITLGTLGLQRFLKEINYNIKIKNIIFSFIIFFNILNFFYLYLFMPQRSFRIHLEEIPLEEPLSAKINTGRILSLGSCLDNQVPSYGICFDYATLWGLYHFAGYDPLVPENNSDVTLGLNYSAIYDREIDSEKLDYFRYWGVKWYITNPKENRYNNYLLKNNIVVKFKNGDRIVYYDKGARPFIYWQSTQNNRGIKYDIKTNTVYINTRNHVNDGLNINFLYNPFFVATIDNKKVDIESKNNQMVIFVPKGQHNIFLKYTDPYFLIGGYASITFLIFTFIYYI